MRGRAPRSTRTAILFPYTTLCRSADPPHPGLANRETGQRRASAAGGRRRLLLRTQLVDIETGAVEGLVAVGLSAHHVRRQWGGGQLDQHDRSEEHTSELQSLMRISYAVFCL